MEIYIEEYYMNENSKVPRWKVKQRLDKGSIVVCVVEDPRGKEPKVEFFRYAKLSILDEIIKEIHWKRDEEEEINKEARVSES